MNKLKAIVAREYLATVRTKAFIVAIVLMPLLVLGSASVSVFAERHADAEQRTCVVVDRTGGAVFAYLTKAAERRSERIARGELNGARFVLSRPPAEDLRLAPEALREKLAARVRDAESFAFVEIDEEVGRGQSAPAARYYSNTPTYLKLHHWLSHHVEEGVHRLRLQQAGLDVSAVERAQTSVDLVMASLHDADSEPTASEERRNPLADVGFPVIIALLTFMTVMSAAGPLMQGVLEEKMHRIAEVLVSSVPPFQLMLGKLLAAAAVAYTLLLLYLGGCVAIAGRVGLLDFVDLAALGWGLLFQAIALLMYGSLFLAVGSACSDLKSSQSLMMPTMMLAVTPMLLLPLILADPNGTAATAVSLFPFFTPILMLLRVTLDPGAPVWQVAVSVLLSGATALLCVWASAKIFRVGMLTQGTTPKLTELWRWLRQD